MPTVTAHTFQDVISLPEARLQSQSVVSSSVYVYTSFATDEEIATRLENDQAIVIRPKDFPPDAGAQAGGGRYTMQVDGTLNVAIWVRLDVDQDGRDDSWLTNSTLGIAPLVTLVVSALEQWMPVDSSNGSYYFIQPLRLLSPGWNFPAKRIGEWGRVDSNWSMVWQMSLS